MPRSCSDVVTGCFCTSRSVKKWKRKGCADTRLDVVREVSADRADLAM